MSGDTLKKVLDEIEHYLDQRMAAELFADRTGPWASDLLHRLRRVRNQIRKVTGEGESK